MTLPPTSIQPEGDSGGWFGRSGRGEGVGLSRSWSLSAASDPVAVGFRLIHEKLLNLFEATGVKRFDSEGKPFDPTIHEAVSVIDSDERESGTVYAEERPGYFINGELLRPARVAVLK